MNNPIIQLTGISKKDYGKETSYQVIIDDNEIWLTGMPYKLFLMLAIGQVMNSRNGSWVDKTYLFRNITARYIYRLKEKILDQLPLAFHYDVCENNRTGYYRLIGSDIAVNVDAARYDSETVYLWNMYYAINDTGVKLDKIPC